MNIKTTIKPYEKRHNIIKRVYLFFKEVWKKFKHEERAYNYINYILNTTSKKKSKSQIENKIKKNT